MPELVLVRSVQRRVALVSAAVVSTALAIGVVGIEWVESIEHQHMLDGRLEQLADTILRLVGDQPQKTASSARPPLPVANEATQHQSIYSYQVWLPAGGLLHQSPAASATKPLKDLTKFGFDSVAINGEMNRVYAVLSPNHAVLVQVAEPIKDRDDDIRLTFGFYLVTLLLPFGFSMGATWFLLRSSFRALDQLAQHLQQHQLLDVGPVANDQAPREFAPVIEAVNSLFHRTSQAFVMEQRFTSMAAHELRTPWAGIRAQAQIACNAQNHDEQQAALQSIVQGIDRASHVFDQLFDLTRVESMQKDITASFQRVQLAMIYQKVLEDLGSKVAAKNISITAELPDGNIQGLDFAIYLLLRNLISNAVLYTPAGGQIMVTVERQGTQVVLTVDDSGKGIPEEARGRAFERFNRLGQHGADGVGLGLSIVAQIVELHGAQIHLLDSPLGGLRVQVTFSAAPLTPTYQTPAPRHA